MAQLSTLCSFVLRSDRDGLQIKTQFANETMVVEHNRCSASHHPGSRVRSPAAVSVVKPAVFGRSNSNSNFAFPRPCRLFTSPPSGLPYGLGWNRKGAGFVCPNGRQFLHNVCRIPHSERFMGECSAGGLAGNVGGKYEWRLSQSGRGLRALRDASRGRMHASESRCGWSQRPGGQMLLPASLKIIFRLDF